MQIVKFAYSWILMNTLEIKRKLIKNKGCTYKIIYIPAAYYPSVPALVPI